MKCELVEWIQPNLKYWIIVIWNRNDANVVVSIYIVYKFLSGTSTIHVEFNHSKDCDAAASIKRKLNGANVKLTQVSKAQMIDGINSLRR